MLDLARAVLVLCLSRLCDARAMPLHLPFDAVDQNDIAVYVHLPADVGAQKCGHTRARLPEWGALPRVHQVSVLIYTGRNAPVRCGLALPSRHYCDCFEHLIGGQHLEKRLVPVPDLPLPEPPELVLALITVPWVCLVLLLECGLGVFAGVRCQRRVVDPVCGRKQMDPSKGERLGWCGTYFTRNKENQSPW